MKALAASLITLLLTLPASALSPGDEVKPNAIAKADFLKGEAIEKWEAGKVYIISCWATGSSPSVLTLPMLEGLHNIYGERGLRVIAINVGENDRQKVADLLTKNGKRITHPVAFVPAGDTFQTEWVEASKVTQLPFTFVVKDGRYLIGDHPAKLTGEIIEGLLAGGAKQQEVLDKQDRQKLTDDLIKEQLKAYSTAQQANDADAMEDAIAKLAITHPEFIHLPRMLVDVSLIRKDWRAATAGLKSIDNPQVALMSAAMISRRFDSAEEQPSSELYEAVAEVLDENKGDDASIKASLARVQWKLGRKKEALSSARLAALEPGPLAKAPLEDFAKSFEGDDPQSLDDLIRALNTKMKEQP